MLVCSSVCTTAHETAGAARIRHSLRPLDERAGSFWQSSGVMRRENAKPYPRRPGLEPGPIRRGPSARTQALATFFNNKRRGVWVPAFAWRSPGRRSKTHDGFLGAAASNAYWPPPHLSARTSLTFTKNIEGPTDEHSSRQYAF